MRRRTFLGVMAAAGVGLGKTAGVRLGVTDWNLHLGARTAAVAKAKELGFAGVQLSFGRDLVDGKLPVDRPEIIAEYLRVAKEHGVTIDGTCVDKLHDNGLKSDPLAMRWVTDSIRMTHSLGVRVLLLPFFGKWAIRTPDEIARVGAALRELAPQAEEAGVVLAVEDTISAEDNARILDAARSKNVLVYYDVGNSTVAGFDVAKEIRWLGKDRICQFHFKDNPHFLGEGTIRFPDVVAAIRDIGWTGWVNLETDSRVGNLEADLVRNRDYAAGLLGV